MTTPAQKTGASNRLAREKSPYLLQHAQNPVDWYPWGEEAFAKARAEDKPVFLSIGYSTCHWCHVMERESFENPEIARLLNQGFVSIKVDREEHPDIDQVYMNAVTALTGQGGWPLTVFLTSDRKPFFGGTYFPPERRGNMAGMKELLPAVADAWRQKREQVRSSAEQITVSLNAHLEKAGDPQTITPAVLDGAFRQAAELFDAAYGGFGEAPKFPRSHELSFLLAYGARAGNQDALRMAAATLDHLARGGIHDQIGGGFHRYSTDGQWLVPHFEKMLYDQALLSRAFLEAFRVMHRPEYAAAVRDIFDYVLRDLTDAQGAFYAAEDADSEGEEGRFYVWTPVQLTEALGKAEAEWAGRYYGVTANGNFEHHTSILHIAQPASEAAPDAARLATVNAQLLAVRGRRVRPHRDDKILTSWNGLMIASLAYGAATLEDARYLQAARRAADFVLARLVREDGTVLRRYRDGEAAYPGTLEDYAFLAYGLTELYEAGGDPRYLEAAARTARAMHARFGDGFGGGFLLRDTTQEPLIVPSKEIYDGATPSGNSVAMLALLRLGRLLGDESLEQDGRAALAAFAGTVSKAPFGYPQLLLAWDFALGPAQELIIAGDPDSEQTRALLRVARGRFLPRLVVVRHPAEGPDREAIERLAPYVAAQTPQGGRPTAYLCEGHVCRLPTTDPEALGRMLDGAPGAAAGGSP